MRLVFRFEKRGSVVYISHLDLLRTFNRALKRAGLPCQFSQGYHPHTVLSFAQALAVGNQSVCEFVDVAMLDDVKPDTAMRRLNDVLTPGLRVTGAWQVADTLPALMALVAASRYEAEPLGLPQPLQEQVDSLLAAQSVPVQKTTAGSVKTVDIRPGILELQAVGGTLRMLVQSGSVNNVRPELVLQALGQDGAQWSILRTQLLVQRDGHLVRFEEILSGEA